MDHPTSTKEKGHFKPSTFHHQQLRNKGGEFILQRHIQEHHARVRYRNADLYDKVLDVRA